MNIGIYCNLSRDLLAEQTKAFVLEAKFYGLECFISSQDCALFDGYNFLPQDEMFNKADIIVVFGGDGTVISTAKASVNYAKPILGINVGNIGFLTEVNKEDIKLAVKMLAQQKFCIEPTYMIKATINNQDFYCLNEALVTDYTLDKHMVDVDIFIDNIKAQHICGDGVMVSTALGSTAYNMSCGGPILSPKVNALIVTAICPHTLTSRPMVVPESSVIKLLATSNHLKQVIIDGKRVADFSGDAILSITKSNKTINFVRFNNSNFYKRLLDKLS
ncbi:MAG: NAD(+)/NADH kinase [Clostridia bacterium]